MKLTCQHCKHKWNYTGSNPYYTSCPHCHYLVKTKGNEKIKGKEK